MRNCLKKQNIIACAILAVALYLNFIHKDSSITDFTAKNTQKAFTSTITYSMLDEISVVTPTGVNQIQEDISKK